MRHRLYLDANVVVDLLAQRQPFYSHIARIATLADTGKLELILSPLSVGIVSYILSKYEKPSQVINKLNRFMIICTIATMDNDTVMKALNSEFSDFEDAMQHYCAISAKCSVIITRNGRDFIKSDLPVMTPKEFLATHS